MARVFLDANTFIDAIHRKPQDRILESLLGQVLYISPLSIHIYCYLFKIKLPNSVVSSQLQKFQIIEFSGDVAEKALHGPTNDFEDNVQLHSAAQAECDLFLTTDRRLLALTFFGKTKIVSGITPKS